MRRASRLRRLEGVDQLSGAHFLASSRDERVAQELSCHSYVGEGPAVDEQVALALDLARQNGLGGVERQAWQVAATATGTAART